MTSRLWVIESLVKIMDQIESIQEIQTFPIFLSGLKGFSGRMPLVGTEGLVVSLSYKLNFAECATTFDCEALDLKFLDRNTFGDKSLRREIIALFLSQMDGLQRSFASPINQTSWRFLTHTMKGAASAVGAKQIANLADAWALQTAPATQAERLHCERELTKCVNDFKLAAAPL